MGRCAGISPRRIGGSSGLLPACCVLLALLLVLAAPATAQDAARPPSYRGRLLVEVLQEVRNQGLKVIFSSAIVDERMRVTVEPAATEPRAILDEILAPLGLLAEDGPAGTVLIVKAGGPSVVSGRVLSSARGTPVSGAVVTIPAAGRGATSGPDGTFRIADVPAGTHDLLVEATGYFQRITMVEVRSTSPLDLLVALEPRSDFVEEIVVTPGRVAIVQQEQPATLSVSDEDVLLAPSFGGDVSRIAESLPGVASPDNSAAFHVRGSLARDVSYIVDGLELYEPYHLRQFQSPFSHLDTEIVDRIDFLGGPFSADFGDRHGGIVQIATRPATVASHTVVSLGNINSHVSHAGRLEGGGVSWLASLRAWYPEEFRTSIEIGEPGLEPKLADAYLTGSFLVSPRTVVSAHALLAGDGFDFQQENEAQTLDTSSRSAHFWLRGLTTWSDRFSSETILSGGWIDRSRSGVSDPEEELELVDDERATDFFGLKYDMTWLLSETNGLRAGIDARHMETEYRYTSGPVDIPSEITTLTPEPSGTSLGLWVADRIAPTPSFAAEIGLRWDRQGWSDDSQVSPRLSALWRLGERSELRVGLGQYFQSQRVYELRVEDGETEFRDAERSRQAGLTFTHRFAGDVRLRVDAYYRALDRLHPRWENAFTPIELYPETEPDRVLVDADRAKLRGIELLLQAPPGDRFYWRASYALSAADDLIHGETVPRSWDQTHAGSFLAGYRVADRWFFTLAGTAHTGWPTTPLRTDLVVPPDEEPELQDLLGPRNADRFPSYLRFDFKASRSFALPRGSLRLELEVLNLTDRDNACCVDDVEAVVQPDGSVDVEGQLGYWLGITPTVRLVWAF